MSLYLAVDIQQAVVVVVAEVDVVIDNDNDDDDFDSEGNKGTYNGINKMTKILNCYWNKWSLRGIRELLFCLSNKFLRGQPIALTNARNVSL